MVRTVYDLRFSRLHQTVHMAGMTSVRTEISLSIADTCSQTIRQPCGLPQLSPGLSCALMKPALVTQSIREFSLSPAMHIPFLKQRSHRKVPHCSHHQHVQMGKADLWAPGTFPTQRLGRSPAPELHISLCHLSNSGCCCVWCFCLQPSCSQHLDMNPCGRTSA